MGGRGFVSLLLALAHTHSTGHVYVLVVQQAGGKGGEATTTGGRSEEAYRIGQR